MKRFIMLCCVALLFLFGLNIAQAQVSVTGISASLRAGDAHQLASYLASNIDTKILLLEGTFSKAATVGKLTTFFRQHPPKAFQVKHKGDAPNGTKFIVGHLVTERERFRVYFVLDKSEITELSFEQEK